MDQMGDYPFGDLVSIAADLDWLDGVSLDPALRRVIRELKAFTVTIENFVGGHGPFHRAEVLCDRRNLAHYKLMCIPSSRDSGSPAESEVCRLATIIFSIGVTFPMANEVPFSVLVDLLQHELQKNELLGPLSIRENGDALYLWVLVMGGIAASGRPERSWFAKELAKTMQHLQSVSWTCLKDKISSVLWLDCACDVPGADLWHEAYSLLQQWTQLKSASASFPALKAPCSRCRLKKIKCDKGTPCEHCVNSQIDCSHENVNKSRPARAHNYTSREKPCDLCRHRRVRCDKNKPCGRCKNGGFECSYAGGLGSDSRDGCR